MALHGQRAFEHMDREQEEWCCCLLLMISKNRKRKPRDGRYMLESRNKERRQINSMTMLYNTDGSSGRGSAEAIAFLAPVGCCALE
jgi:hypothetical protein